MFGAGLVLWRYKLVLFDGWAVYASDLPPDIDSFIALADAHCPPETAVAYVAGPHFGGYSRVRYALYPRPVISVLVGTERTRNESIVIHGSADLWPLVDEFGLACFMVDDAGLDFAADAPIKLDKITFAGQKYLLIPVN